MEPMEQLRLWAEGSPVHNEELNLHCPDTSCCGGVLAPEHLRRRYVAAYEELDFRTMSVLSADFTLVNVLSKNKDTKIDYSQVTIQ